jgi:hypothetical protein
LRAEPGHGRVRSAEIDAERAGERKSHGEKMGQAAGASMGDVEGSRGPFSRPAIVPFARVMFGGRSKWLVARWPSSVGLGVQPK